MHLQNLLLNALLMNAPFQESAVTHVSSMFQGTITHMAPEVLMEGKQSKAADVSGSEHASMRLTHLGMFVSGVDVATVRWV